MPIPAIYRTTGEGALANYDYTDLAEGTGVVKLYGFNVNVSGAISFILSKNDIYSYTVETVGNDTVTFNLSAFNLPKTVKGTAFVRFSAIGPGSGDICYVVTIQKTSKGVTTTLGTSMQTPTLTVLAVRNLVLQTTIPQTNFEVGDILSVKVEPVGTGGNYFAHDPANRNGINGVTPAATYPTKFEVYIPFRIDL